MRQIEANRRNAARSTGPNTEAGKNRSRRNAIRHGLCAETIVESVEDLNDYRSFEAAVIADYDARTAVERELVLRLASLLWRLRRSTQIETELLRIQTEILMDNRRHFKQSRSPLSTALGANPSCIEYPEEAGGSPGNIDSEPRCDAFGWSVHAITPGRLLAHGFQRLANLDNGVFERLNRYESGLSRQIVRVLFLIGSASVR